VVIYYRCLGVVVVVEEEGGGGEEEEEEDDEEEEEDGEEEDGEEVGTIFTGVLILFDYLADGGSKLLQNIGKYYQRTLVRQTVTSIPEEK
jgi:predicted hydrocarbon binding protein